MAWCLLPQAITWTNVDLYSLGPCALEMLMKVITTPHLKFTHFELKPHLPRHNELRPSVIIANRTWMSTIMNVSTKFEINLLSGLSGNAQRLLDQDIFICGCIESYYFDNFWCRQCKKNIKILTFSFQWHMLPPITKWTATHWATMFNTGAITNPNSFIHDDIIKWKHFPRYWPFVQGIHRSRWIPLTKASDAELWCFLWSTPE